MHTGCVLEGLQEPDVLGVEAVVYLPNVAAGLLSSSPFLRLFCQVGHDHKSCVQCNTKGGNLICHNLLRLCTQRACI